MSEIIDTERIVSDIILKINANNYEFMKDESSIKVLDKMEEHIEIVKAFIRKDSNNIKRIYNYFNSRSDGKITISIKKLNKIINIILSINQVCIYHLYTYLSINSSYTFEMYINTDKIIRIYLLEKHLPENFVNRRPPENIFIINESIITNIICHELVEIFHKPSLTLNILKLIITKIPNAFKFLLSSIKKEDYIQLAINAIQGNGILLKQIDTSFLQTLIDHDKVDIFFHAIKSNHHIIHYIKYNHKTIFHKLVEKYFTKVETEHDTCIICQQNLSNTVLICNHSCYCIECLNIWFDLKDYCPYCRTPCRALHKAINDKTLNLL
jgi:hypothetical protein